MKNSLSFAVALVFSLSIYSSCGEYEALEVDKEAHRVADSLFRAHKDSLTSLSDTLCEINHRKLFQIYFDSIKLVESDKIKQLINK
jgi:hypothetical protein